MKRTIMIAALAGCASNPEPMDIPDGCNPLLGGSDCFLPYPSDVFAEADPSMPSGRRITLTRPAMLLTDEGKSADPTKWRAIDGYSRLPTIITTLGAPMDAAGLPAILGDPTLSVADDSPTLIVDTVTQRRVPHFVDLDPRATDPLRQALVIHPLQALEPKRRYIVALRGVRGPGGGAIVAPEGFRRLRDDAAGDDPALHELAARYDEDVFEPLAATGVARDTLQLAWDFTTGSDEHVTSDMFDARDRALAALDAAPPTVTIDSVEALTDGVTWRRIRGRITGPSVLDGAELHRDAEGRVSVDGTTTFGFTALIPHSAKDATRPAPFVGYGHGFFQTREELTNYGTPTIAAGVGAVFLSIDWVGMSRPDLPGIIETIFDEPNTVLGFTDRIHQAMVNWMSVTAAFDGALAKQDAFHHPDTGTLLYDTAEPYYLGISMGHILGGVSAALNPRFRRYALEVGGAGYTLMMFRAQPFRQFLFAMASIVTDPLDQQKVAAVGQRHFDRIDPGIYARYVRKQPLANSPERQLLLQVGLGDRLVPNVASYFHARMLGAQLTGPAAVPPWGIEIAEGSPQVGLTVFDFGEDLSFYADANPTEVDNGVHGDVRLTEASQAQLRAFFQPTGSITHPCDGPCAK